MPADQVPGNGEFLLYPNIPPMLLAGKYTLTADQTITANGRTAAQLPVDELDVHLDVRSPRLVLPPDQVLSTFPPAESEGAYGSRLPQVVIRRRTLPWERKIAGAPANPVTPWLALVVVAEGEATLVPNVPAAQTITPGVTLAGAIDADVGHCLEIRQSMVNTIFPTRKDVPLLAHARHVDINDTELMMGDDDGFLAVVVANRLPMAGRGAGGEETPVKYTACLVNLEGQWDRLLPTAPPPVLTSVFIGLQTNIMVSSATMDKHVMGGQTHLTNIANVANVPDVLVNDGRVGATRAGASAAADTHFIADATRDVAAASQTKTSAGFSATKTAKGALKGEVSGVLASERLRDAGIFELDPTLRFPVLLHWRFTTVGTATFEVIMRNLDSGLLGTVAKKPPKDDAGRLPLELVDTGHVGIEQKTRRGDSVRAWYRGPFVPHPTDDAAANRLPLAHAADQLRVVIPDGREDLSLASAFEIGRLLALANPNMVAALLRWRQLHYATVRRTSAWHLNATLLGAINGFVLAKRITNGAATDLSRAMMRAVTDAPTQFLGAPRSLVDPGVKLPFAGNANTIMANAFGLPELRGDPARVLETLQKTPVRVAPVTERVGRVPGEAFTELDAKVLTRTLEARVERLMTDAVPKLREVPGRGGPVRGSRTPARDALDDVIDRLSRNRSTESDE
jgi:hypothetical protein